MVRKRPGRSLDAIKSDDYRSILQTICVAAGSYDTFRLADVQQKLSESESKKLQNFLQRMKQLNVLTSGERKGEYVFTMRMVPLYISLKGMSRK